MDITSGAQDGTCRAGCFYGASFAGGFSCPLPRRRQWAASVDQGRRVQPWQPASGMFPNLLKDLFIYILACGGGRPFWAISFESAVYVYIRGLIMFRFTGSLSPLLTGQGGGAGVGSLLPPGENRWRVPWNPPEPHPAE